MAEYGLLIALVAIAVIAAVTLRHPAFGRLQHDRRKGLSLDLAAGGPSPP